ncbi:hypothetical protein GOBAR_DD09145 [Gossypium barbadense]|nr:hypothetical protein GOBAR_DD09145 [Gossypium barbadense]
MVERRKKVADSNQKGKAPMHEVEVDVEMPSKQEVKRPGLQSINIEVVDNEDGTIEDVSMIHLYPQGYVLNNWTAVDLLVVFKSSPECLDINGMKNPVTDPEIDFEKAVCLGEFEVEKNIEDCVSYLDLLRMVE